MVNSVAGKKERSNRAPISAKKNSKRQHRYHSHHLLVLLVGVPEALIGSGGQTDLGEDVEFPRQHIPDVVVRRAAGEQVLDQHRISLPDPVSPILCNRRT